MIRSFKDKATEDIFDGRRTKAGRKTLPHNLWEIAFHKLDQLDAAVSLRDLEVPTGNRLEALRGDRKGQHSIRINDQFRGCFRWTDNGAKDVEIVDYHR